MRDGVKNNFLTNQAAIYLVCTIITPSNRDTFNKIGYQVYGKSRGATEKTLRLNSRNSLSGTSNLNPF